MAVAIEDAVEMQVLDLNDTFEQQDHIALSMNKVSDLSIRKLLGATCCMAG